MAQHDHSEPPAVYKADDPHIGEAAPVVALLGGLLVAMAVAFIIIWQYSPSLPVGG